MDMLFVNVRNDDRLRIVPESVSHKSLGYLVSLIRRDVIIGRKTLYVMDSFYSAFSLQWRRAVKIITRKLIVNELHLLVSRFGVGHAVYRGRIKQLLGLFGVQNVAQTFLDRSVESDVLTVRQRSVTPFRNISMSSA